MGSSTDFFGLFLTVDFVRSRFFFGMWVFPLNILLTFPVLFPPFSQSYELRPFLFPVSSQVPRRGRCSSIFTLSSFFWCPPPLFDSLGFPRELSNVLPRSRALLTPCFNPPRTASVEVVSTSACSDLWFLVWGAISSLLLHPTA